MDVRKRLNRIRNTIIFLVVLSFTALGAAIYLYFGEPSLNCPTPVELSVVRKDDCIEHYWTRDYELNGNGEVVAVSRYIGTDYDKAQEMLGATEYLSVQRSCK